MLGGCGGNNTESATNVPGPPAGPQPGAATGGTTVPGPPAGPQPGAAAGAAAGTTGATADNNAAQ